MRDVIRVAIYARVSTKKDSQKDSLDHQLALGFDYAAQRGWQVVGQYVDNGISGKSLTKRPQMMSLMEDARSGKFDVVFSKSLSRLGRNTVEMLTTAAELVSLNIRLILLEDNHDSETSKNKMIFTIKAALAEEESAKLSERIKLGRLASAKQGNYQASITAFGYKRDETSTSLILHEEYAPVARKIFDLFLYEQWGLYRISNYLTERGIPTPRTVAGVANGGSRWQQSSVKTILENIIYTGTLAQHREEVENYMTGKRKAIDPNEQVIVENAHPAIITMDEHTTVIERLRSKGRNKSNGQESLFAHIAVCADCKKGMTLRKDRGKGIGGAYVCTGYVKYTRKFCSSHLIEKDKLLQMVKNDLRGLVQGNVSLDKLYKKAYGEIDRSEPNHAKELTHIEKQLSELQNKVLSLVELFTKKSITLDQFNELNQALTEKKEQLSSRKRELQMLVETKKDTEQYLSAFRKKIELVANMDIEDEAVLKRVLQKLIQKIEVHEDGSIKIHYNFARPLSLAMGA